MSKLMTFFCIISCCCFCSNSNQQPEPDNSIWCSRIDSLIKEFYYEKYNRYANKTIPQLIKESKIDASCEKGIGGYNYYHNDSLFNADIKRWKEYFKCK